MSTANGAVPRLLRVLPSGQRGGVALLMLLAFMGLGVPLAVAAVSTAGQLARASRVYDSRLTGMYNAGSGIEVALYELLSDPTFDDDMTPGDPNKQVEFDVNGETVTVVVTKVYTSQNVEGQGLVITKSVLPTSTSPGVPTTLTYTITVKNEGTATSTLEQIVDYAPPSFAYVTNSVGGDISSANPTIDTHAAQDDWYYLNDAGSNPRPLERNQGNDRREASHTPAQGTWETVTAHYWETDAYPADGVLPAQTWNHWMWLETPSSSNRWRWKVQRVRGGTPTDLFTSPDGGAPTSWDDDLISYNPGDIDIQSADSLRLYVEVYSTQSSSSNRQFDYRWGGDETSGPDWDSRTEIPLVERCGIAQDLTWNLSPYVEVAPQEELTLTFQATSTPANGTYFNQVGMRYNPWWDTSDVYVYSPYTAEVAVGTATPKCGYDMDIVVNKTVDTPEADPGTQVEVTYTISVENPTATSQDVCAIKDLLPPDFTYVNGSAGEYGGNIATWDPDDDWDSDYERWELTWEDESGFFADDPIVTLAPDETKTQQFRASVVLEPGVEYFNEAWAEYEEDGFWFGLNCALYWLLGATPSNGGAGQSSSVSASPMYDIQAIAADGTILSRALVSEIDGTVEILSWQQN